MPFIVRQYRWSGTIVRKWGLRSKAARQFLRRGFAFPETREPTYEDFLSVSFAIGLTYAMSDVNVTNEIQRRTVLIHSIIFFYSTVLGVVLNAIVTS